MKLRINHHQQKKQIPIVTDGKWGVGRDEREYIHDWKPLKAHYFRVDTATGERHPMLKALHCSLGLSPDSRHFAYWEDANVWVCDLDAGSTRNLTKNAPVSFVDQEYDYFGEKPCYGVAGWSKDGEHIILNHRYDLWSQPLDGKEAVNLTGGVGAENEIILRYVKLDEEEKTIDLSKSLILSAYGQWTKKAGFYRLEANASGTKKAEPLLFVDKSFSELVKAKDADQYMFSMQSFIDCPDYYGSDGSFTNPRRVTDANPQQVEYSWGHSVLLDYTNKDGVRLQAALAIPDSRKGNERMPMLVSFYEKSAHRLHKYVSPAYAYSSWSVQMEMISKGYMMLAPDVHFRVGSTDEDMLECVEAAVDKAIELGYADPDRIGLCGHSFSGAGAVYIATRSKKFAAVSAGAGSVEPGMFHYLWGYSADRKTGAGENAHHCETYGQCRMGLLPVEDWESYRSESAIDCVPKMTTSLLLMQGESDDIVAWADAIFIYNAMRLHGKKIILLSYPKEGHSLAKRVNRVDFTNRVMEFFDHHLKGKPAPDWITKGVPFLDKESS